MTRSEREAVRYLLGVFSIAFATGLLLNWQVTIAVAAWVLILTGLVVMVYVLVYG